MAEIRIKYQIVFTGQNHRLVPEIKSQIRAKIKDLGLHARHLVFIDKSNFALYQSQAPSVCIYFGTEGEKTDLQIIQQLMNDVCPIIPAVDDLKIFSTLVPDELRPLNGFELNNKTVSALVSQTLEVLGLLRKSRKLFISYRRKDSRSVALQLYNFLDSRGFNVFLDTHSIRPGAEFQNELWHNLADTDVLILLNTNNFVGNKWTDAELAQASAMSIGITQLVWPDCNNKAFINKTAWASPIYLEQNDFTKSNYDTLTNDFLSVLEISIENLRARSLAARRDNLIKEFMRAAERMPTKATLQPENTIYVTDSNKKVIAVVPAVGVPDVYNSYQREAILKKVKSPALHTVCILYDHRNILAEYLAFVQWLNPLTVKFLNVTQVDSGLLKLAK